jgi:hypothetical protein
MGRSLRQFRKIQIVQRLRILFSQVLPMIQSIRRGSASAESWAADFLLTAGTGPDFRKPIANSARLNGPDNELSALREECRIFFGAC